MRNYGGILAVVWLTAGLGMACGTPSTAPSGGGGSAPQVLMVARGLSANGAPEGIADAFDSGRDHNVFVFVPVKGLASETKISYVRYLNGKYLDNRSAKLARPGLFLIFEMKAKAGHKLVPGVYRYQIYLNGKYRDQIQFRIS